MNIKSRIVLAVCVSGLNAGYTEGRIMVDQPPLSIFINMIKHKISDTKVHKTSQFEFDVILLKY